MSASTENLVCFVGQRDPRPSYGVTGPVGEPVDGPVLALINHHRFDQVYLLCNSDDTFERATQIRFECDDDPELPKVNILSVDIRDIIDHSGIYRSLLGATTLLRERYEHRSPRWSVLLDPGTPQMQTAWILLVRSGAFDATLLQGIPPRFNNGVYTCREVNLSDEALPTILPLGERTAVVTERTATGKKVDDLPAKSFDDIIDSGDLVIRDSSTLKVFRQAWQVAGFDHENHLILGETGTGKSELAEWIHRSGPRAAKVFHPINCATLTPATAESALFGHKKGAYTGAESDRPGALRTADGGVLFLDEIGDLNLELQARLLTVLDGQPFLPMGSDESVTVDVVVIAATNKDLQEMVEKETFRADLYARLATVPLTMPPLRDRPEDLKAIIEEKLSYWNLHTQDERTISQETQEILQNYNWPRNIRELEQALKRSFMLAPKTEVQPDDLPEEILKAAGEGYHSRYPRIEIPESGLKLREFLNELEKDAFRQAIERTGGVMARAAALLGWEAPAFRKAVKERHPELMG
jgi:DNA-binding NtrC family response regulator